MLLKNKEKSSFRDNSGYIFEENGTIYRFISTKYQAHYEKLMKSGLYQALVEKKMLISHEEMSDNWESGYRIIQPQQLSFISYPAGWSFSMLKDAALLTLAIQRLAFQHGMILKDASAYNVQFIGSMPLFIDTLSFETYEAGKAWQAYGQFCRHFLAPLSLMSYIDISLGKLLVNHLDGIPIPLTSKLLPLKTKLNLGLYLHIHLHGKTQVVNQDKKVKKIEITKKSIENLIENLSSTVAGLKYLPQGTEWSEYYEKDVANTYLKDKKVIIRGFLERIQPKKVLDLGANDGTFSRLAAEYAKAVYSFDIDPACVEQNYLALKKENNQCITPLLADAANPEPAIGWDNTERPRLWDRAKPDTIMALALIHHLCISNNLPLEYLAKFFAAHCQYLIIEWVPKSDEKVIRLLQNREDIFDNYTEDCFLKAMQQYFVLLKVEGFELMDRKMFLFKTK
jgi:ribosomal protein L11 methylase PrmA